MGGMLIVDRRLQLDLARDWVGSAALPFKTPDHLLSCFDGWNPRILDTLSGLPRSTGDVEEQPTSLCALLCSPIRKGSFAALHPALMDFANACVLYLA